MAKVSRFLFNCRVTAKETTWVAPAECLKFSLAMTNNYDQNTKLREFPSGVAAYARFSSNGNWQPVTVKESEVQIVTLEFTDGRVLRSHKDNVRVRAKKLELFFFHVFGVFTQLCGTTEHERHLVIALVKLYLTQDIVCLTYPSLAMVSFRSGDQNMVWGCS